jgi:hypothetical protein
LRIPLPFLPRSGWDAYQNTKDDKALAAAEKRWNKSHEQSWSEGTQVATRLALRARDPFATDAACIREQFRSLSRQIFDAVVHGDVDPARVDGDRA